MNSNSNLTITDYKVNPTSQQISEVYINGEKLETGGEPKLQEINVNIINTNYFDEHSGNSYAKYVEPDVGYDGLSKVNFYVNDALMAPNTLYEATLGSNKKVLIENISINSNGYITSFSGNLYTMYGSSTGVFFGKANYQVTEGPCGGTKTVRVDGANYTTATLSWS